MSKFDDYYDGIDRHFEHQAAKGNDGARISARPGCVVCGCFTTWRLCRYCEQEVDAVTYERSEDGQRLAP